MKFTSSTNNGVKIEMELSEDSTIPEVLAEFENFLRACGYIIDYNKTLELVDIDE